MSCSLSVTCTNLVDGSGQRYSVLLTAGQVHTLFTNLRFILSWKSFYVIRQLAGFNDQVIPTVVQRLLKDYILS